MSIARKLICGAFILTITLSLSACSGHKDEGDAPPGSNVATVPLKDHPPDKPHPQAGKAGGPGG